MEFFHRYSLVSDLPRRLYSPVLQSFKDLQFFCSSYTTHFFVFVWLFTVFSVGFFVDQVLEVKVSPFYSRSLSLFWFHRIERITPNRVSLSRARSREEKTQWCRSIDLSYGQFEFHVKPTIKLIWVVTKSITFLQFLGSRVESESEEPRRTNQEGLNVFTYYF